MTSRFRPNITRTGRILRFILGSALILAGIGVYPIQAWIAWALFLSGAFVLFEAARGWCALRACGIKTKW